MRGSYLDLGVKSTVNPLAGSLPRLGIFPFSHQISPRPASCRVASCKPWGTICRTARQYAEFLAFPVQPWGRSKQLTTVHKLHSFLYRYCLFVVSIEHTKHTILERTTVSNKDSPYLSGWNILLCINLGIIN